MTPTDPLPDTLDSERRSSARGGIASASQIVPALDPIRFLRAAAGRPRGFWQADGRWTAWAGAAVRIEAGADEPRAAPEAAAHPVSGAPGPTVRFGEGEVGPAAGALSRVRRDVEELLGWGWIGCGEGADRPPRFFGGAAFEPGRHARAAGAWLGFPPAGFVLPALTADGPLDGIAGRHSAARVTLSRRMPARAVPERGLGLAREGLERILAGAGARWAGDPGTGGFEEYESDREEGRIAAVESMRRVTDRAAWRSGVSRALARIERGEVEKVVLARSVDVARSDVVDPVQLLARLRARDPESWLFLVELRPGHALVGASPELLCSLAAGTFRSMAVAGSAPRSDDPVEDDRLGRSLLGSDKDRREHAVGVREVRERLRGLGVSVRSVSGPRLLKLAGIQHLRTDLRARVGDAAHLLPILAALHPTAAVCGHPRRAALEVLREVEPAARGWYAGPIGWFDGEGDGAFAPGLRCAAVQGRTLRITAGAGIVRGSDPDAEWEEVRLKLHTVLRAVGLDATLAVP